jgi:lysophospholipase L1-like esterase
MSFKEVSRRMLGIGALVVILSCVACFLCSELLLRIFLPIRSFTVGTSNTLIAPNAAIYGWGQPPGGEIKQVDPDTGKAFSSRANSGGWKDVEHQLKKKNGSARILILGDSQTFGFVPMKDIYPRVLETLLGDAGFDAEVISMGYGGWGTDQALVALKRSGLSYEPDIVISQFDTNDLIENLALSGIEVQKPFRFQVVNGALNMRTVKSRPESWLKNFLLKSHLVFYTNSARWVLSERISQFRKEDKRQVEAKTNESAPGRSPTGPYFIFHMSQQGDPGIEAAWLLYEKLIEEMKRSSEQKRAIFLLFNGVEKGLLAWAKRAGRIVEDETGHDAILWQGKLHPIYYYRHVDRLKDISDRIGALMIPNKRSYTRFANDAHSNIEGNQRMAEDIFDFLITNEKTSPVLRLARDGERQAAVAQVGQRRALNEHTRLRRMQELQGTISRYC